MPFLENIWIIFLIKKKIKWRVDYVSKVTTRSLSCLISYFLSFDPHNVSGNRQLRRTDRLLWLPFVVVFFLVCWRFSISWWSKEKLGRCLTAGWTWTHHRMLTARMFISLMLRYISEFDSLFFFLIPLLWSSAFTLMGSGCCVFRCHPVSNTPSQVGVKFPSSSIRSDIIII